MGTFSTNLLLSLLTFGESAANGFDNWGESANFNFGRLDSKLGSKSTHSLAAGDVTLSANAESSLFLQFTGSLSDDTVVNVSTRPGFWLMSNEATGDFSVTLLPSGGTGVAIPAGTSLVYSDGTEPVVIQSGGGGGGSEIIYEASSLTLSTAAPLDILNVASGYRSIEIQGEITSINNSTNSTNLLLSVGDGSTWGAIASGMRVSEWSSGESDSRPFLVRVSNLDEADMSILVEICKSKVVSVEDESYFLRPSYTGNISAYDGRPITSFRFALSSSTAKSAAIRHLRIVGHR